MHTPSHTHTYMQTSRVISQPKYLARVASLVLDLQMFVTLSSPFTDVLVLFEMHLCGGAVCSLPLVQWFCLGDDFVPPGHTGRCLETFSVVTNGHCTGIQSIEARDAVEHPVSLRTAPTAKSYQAQNTSSSRVEKPYSVVAQWACELLVKASPPRAGVGSNITSELQK